jgi:adenosyl cobinamide kinase/adenosyl cobinamide phosphate guanylyltransferase
VLGGARSGKSAFAERLVEALPPPWRYVATGWEADDDMAARIEQHRARRGPSYETVEAGARLAEALAGDRPTLVDSLGTWVAAHEDFAVDLDALLDALRARSAPTVVVSDEVGLGVHPSTEVGRRFRDALGLVNQAVAEVADDVWLVVAGRGLRCEPRSPS